MEAVWDGTSGNHTARITNLSEGGCYLDTVGETNIGEIVCFRVLMPDEDWLYLEGEVRHHRPSVGFGVQFVDLNEEQEQKVASLIQSANEAGTDAPPLSADLVED
jgi:PilZ domain-containing protein